MITRSEARDADARSDCMTSNQKIAIWLFGAFAIVFFIVMLFVMQCTMNRVNDVNHLIKTWPL